MYIVMKDLETHLSSVFPPRQYINPLFEIVACPYTLIGSFLISPHFIALEQEEYHC